MGSLEPEDWLVGVNEGVRSSSEGVSLGMGSDRVVEICRIQRELLV